MRAWKGIETGGHTVVRARPLGEVVREYNSLRRVTGSTPCAPETNTYQGARLKEIGTTRQVKAARLQ